MEPFLTRILPAVFALVLAINCAEGRAATPSESDAKALLAQIKSKHRVLWPDDGEAKLKGTLGGDPDLQFVWESVQHAAEEMLAEPLVKRELIGKRLLDKSRTALERTMYLGMVYRMTRDHRFAERAVREMLNVAAFQDWNPSHFLDVAEMTAAMGIGLDWCRDAMTDQDIATVRSAIIAKGLKQSFAENYSWIHGENNWNQVCHGGLTLGALAVSDTDPDLAARIIVRAVGSLPYVMKNYAPDGAYPEGPSYWGYGTTYNVIWLSSMQAALGTDFDLSREPGFLQTGAYMLHVVGPTGLCFNYSDSGRQTKPSPEPAKVYFASATRDPSLIFPDRQWIDEMRDAGPEKIGLSDAERFLPLLLIWAGPSKDQTPTALHYAANGITPIATYRTGWDREATYVAIKGGSASTSHAHMDAGTFVIDALGERWIDSLGSQSYESLEHEKVDLWNFTQNSQRWQVFRLGPMSQNVLTVDDKPQQVAGRATLMKSDAQRAVIDLGPVYANQLASVRRGVWLQPGGSVTLRDEVTAADSPATARFAFLTRADVQLNEDGATLKLDGKSLTLTVSGVPGLHMETFSTVGPQPYDAPNPGTRMVGFKVPLSPGDQAWWEVRFVPQGKSASSSLGALANW